MRPNLWLLVRFDEYQPRLVDTLEMRSISCISKKYISRAKFIERDRFAEHLVGLSKPLGCCH